ncbi:MAG: hypothetical protein GWP05_05535, partial [Anaerolineaceae bacterium]|nr:hypothetical protein [Anaerolineaceae bacterium]
MTQLLQWLLGVDRIKLTGGGRIVLDFLSAWPAWAIFLAVLVTVAYVWSIYRRENPATPPVMRGFLCFLRSALILLALGMIFEPALKLERNEEIRSAVALLVDRTASMTITDAEAFEQQYKGDTDAPGVDQLLSRGGVVPEKAGQPTRWEIARAALAVDLADERANGLKRLAAQQRVYLYVFDENPQLVKRIDSPEMVDEALADLAAIVPGGKRTAVTQAIEAVLEQLAGQTLTGIVLLSDGQSTVPADTRKLEQIIGDVQILTVGLGSTSRAKDAEILRVIAEQRAFINEELPLRVELKQTGFAGREVELELTVKGRPEMTVTKPVTLQAEGRKQAVELRVKPEQAGKYEMEVTLKPLPGESDEQNNVSLPFEVEVLDRKLKVLIIEDLPRWEYQYMKNALQRDPTVLVSVLLHSADVMFAPEGDLPIRSFPESREKLFEYDVIVIGDVDRRMFSGQQMAWIDEFVRIKGGGLILLAGDRGYNPNSYVDTPLETLLPVEISEEQLVGEIASEFKPRRTIAGSISPILRFEKDMQENRKVWENLPGFYWYYRSRAAKPGAQVLLEHPDEIMNAGSGQKFPIMLIQRVGAGQVFFSAVDSTWRWRWYTGRRYFNSFWLQLIRYMALPQEQAVIETESLRYTLGETAKIQLRIADTNRVGPELRRVTAVVTSQASDGRPEQLQVVLGRSNPLLAIFEGEFTPQHTGKFVLKSEIPSSKAPLAAEGDFLVAPSREEFRRPVRDAAALEKLSKLSDRGQVLGPHEISRLPE